MGRRGRAGRSLATWTTVALSIGIAWLVTTRLAGAQDVIIDRVMAVVEGQLIMQSDVDAAIALGLVPVGDAAEPRSIALDGLIDRRLMLREVERYVPLDPGAEAVGRRLSEMRDRLPSPQAWEDALARSGLDDAGVRALANDSLRIEAYLDERFGNPPDPTDAEVRAYYQEHQDGFVRDGQVMSLAEVRPALVESLRQQRRDLLIGNWLNGLRRRADIRMVYGSNLIGPTP